MQFMNYVTRLQNEYYGNTPSSNSSCPSTPAQWCTDDVDGHQLCITSPTLLPTCLLALIIGLFSSRRIHRLPSTFQSRWVYQLTFFLFGIMMTSAGILHCFLDDGRKLSDILQDIYYNPLTFIQLFVTVIDVGLTTNIAVSFLFCGLCDIHFLDPTSICTRFLLLCSYCTVFLLWTLGIINQWKWIFHILYIDVIAICCSIYFLTQLFIRSRYNALPCLLLGGVYGALGLAAASFGADHICKSEGPYWSRYIGPEFIWFLFSDISMALIFLYVVKANPKQETKMKTKTKSNDSIIHLNNYPEKF